MNKASAWAATVYYDARAAFREVAYSDAGWRKLPGSNYREDGKSYEAIAAASDKARKRHPALAAAMDRAYEAYADADFFAAARQDVPALAREVLALRAERDVLRESLRWALTLDSNMTWCRHQMLGHPCEPDCPYARALALLEEAKP